MIRTAKPPCTACALRNLRRISTYKRPMTTPSSSQARTSRGPRSRSFASSSSSSTPARLPTRPFTPSDLVQIRRKLGAAANFSPRDAPPHTVQSKRTPSEAAVLLGLMNVDDEPCMLMQVRASGLRVHAGEVSFPGGKADPIDRTLVDTALREGNEELDLPIDHVEVLGSLDPPEYSLGNKSRVWAMVGFIHDRPFKVIEHGRSYPMDRDSPLPSLPISALTPSPSEVSAILPLPLSALTEEARSLHFFRMDPRKPYWKYKVDKYIHQSGPGNESGEDLEVWGLSGWFLNRLGRKMGWLDEPKVDAPHD